MSSIVDFYYYLIAESITNYELRLPLIINSEKIGINDQSSFKNYQFIINQQQSTNN